jgi:hypothetical protein
MRLPTSHASTYPDFTGQEWNPIESRNPNKSNPIDDKTQETSDTSLALNDTDKLEVTFPQQITDDTSSPLLPQKGKRKRLLAKQKGLRHAKKSKTEQPQVVHPQTETGSTHRPERTIIVPPCEDVLVAPLAASIQIVLCAAADLYALEFICVDTSEKRKQDILWIVLRILQEASLLRGEGISIPEYLHIIRNHLQQVRVDVVLKSETNT